MNNVAVRICMQVFVHMYVFISLEYYLGMKLLGPYNNSVFDGWRECQRVFQSRCTILYPHRYCARAPTSLRAHQHFLLSVFLTIANLACRSGISWLWFAYFWWLVMLAIFLFAYWSLIYFLWRRRMHVLSPFLNSVIYVFITSCKDSLDILSTNPLSDMWFANIFSPFLGCLVTFLMVPFGAQKWLCDGGVRGSLPWKHAGVSEWADVQVASHRFWPVSSPSFLSHFVFPRLWWSHYNRSNLALILHEWQKLAVCLHFIKGLLFLCCW